MAPRAWYGLYMCNCRQCRLSLGVEREVDSRERGKGERKSDNK